MSELDNVDDKVPTTVKQDLVNLDGVFDNTNAVRDAVLKKLEPVITEMTIAVDSPKLLEAQMGMINTYLSVLNGKETNISKRVSSKLKQVETESVSKHSAAVTDILNQISTGKSYFNNNRQPFDQNTIDHQVEEEFQKSGLAPILTSELKTDPKDLHP